MAAPAGGRGLSWAGQQRIVVATLGLWVSAECSRRVWFDEGSYLSSHCVRHRRKAAESGRAAGCCQQRKENNRGRRKNTSFYPCSLCLSHVQFLIQCSLLSCFHLLSPCCLSLCPPLTQTPNPPHFTPHSFLNPKSLLPSLVVLFNCSPHTSLLPTSSLISCLSITSEHATSQQKPFYTPQTTAAHLFSLLYLPLLSLLMMHLGFCCFFFCLAEPLIPRSR